MFWMAEKIALNVTRVHVSFSRPSFLRCIVETIRWNNSTTRQCKNTLTDDHILYSHKHTQCMCKFCLYWPYTMYESFQLIFLQFDIKDVSCNSSIPAIQKSHLSRISLIILLMLYLRYTICVVKIALHPIRYLQT